MNFLTSRLRDIVNTVGPMPKAVSAKVSFKWLFLISSTVYMLL